MQTFCPEPIAMWDVKLPHGVLPQETAPTEAGLVDFFAASGCNLEPLRSRTDLQAVHSVRSYPATPIDGLDLDVSDNSTVLVRT